MCANYSFISGGDLLTPRIVETFITKVLKGRIGVKNLYGMTEIGVVTNFNGKDLLDLSKAYSCGCLSPGVICKVSDIFSNIPVQKLWYTEVETQTLQKYYVLFQQQRTGLPINFKESVKYHHCFLEVLKKKTITENLHRNI